MYRNNMYSISEGEGEKLFRMKFENKVVWYGERSRLEWKSICVKSKVVRTWDLPFFRCEEIEEGRVEGRESRGVEIRAYVDGS